MIELEEISYDLDEILQEEEHICETYTKEFDKEMLDLGLFDYGCTRRSHRIITEKAKKLTTKKIICLLIDKTPSEYKRIINRKKRKKELKLMFKLAKKYNYKFIKN